jgi:hypothetical protein
MRSERAHYEVRCPHCDVSFPVETRTCIHCGGKTVAASEAPSVSMGALPVFEFDSDFDRSDESPLAFPAGESTGEFDSMQPATASSERLEGGEVDSEAPSVGRSILGSVGSLVWIALLIAFSLSSRMCGE